MLEEVRAWRKRTGAAEMTLNPDYDPERADWRFVDRHGGDDR
jgi:hypothetical protein